MNALITAREKAYLRELAQRQQSYAQLPVMAEREALWRKHNALCGARPMIVIEEDTFLDEILPPPQCETVDARRIERRLLQVIQAHELFDDDKVVPDFFPVFFDISGDFLGVQLKKRIAKEGLGFHIEPVLHELENGLGKLQPTEYRYYRQATEQYAAVAQDAIGDILPVVYKNSYNHWNFGITQRIVNMMGTENMFCAMMDEPVAYHQLMQMATDDLIACLRWQEENDLLLPNSGNDYMGSGSYCFGGGMALPAAGKPVRSINVWGHMNSQESVGISPAVYAEFVYPYYEMLARQFGLVYYGCCEPVHEVWDGCLEKLPNLRKVSISPWCDEAFMAERLNSGKVIYSRKPSPNYLGITAEFDEAAFTASIKKTAQLTSGGCRVEFIFRDVYTLNGNAKKLRQVVDITRGLTEALY